MKREVIVSIARTKNQRITLEDDGHALYMCMYIGADMVNDFMIRYEEKEQVLLGLKHASL